MPEENQFQPVINPSLEKLKRNWKKILPFLFIGLFIISLVGVGIWLLISKPVSPPFKELEKQATSSDQNKIKEEEKTRIIFIRNSDVYSVYTDGSSEIKIVVGVVQAKASLDFRTFVLVKEYNLWVADVDGKELKQLTNVGKDETEKFHAIDVTIVALSPEGKKIFYSVKPVGTLDYQPGKLTDPSIKYGFYLYNLVTQQNTFITEEKTLSDFDYVGWLANEDSLLFIDGGKKEGFLYSFNTNSKIIEKFSNNLYPGLTNGYQTSLSMNKSLITWRGSSWWSYDKSLPSKSSQIFISKLDGTNRKQISATGKWGEYQWPSISFNSRYVSFEKHALDEPSAGKGKIYLYDVMSGETRFLANTDRDSIWLDDRTMLIHKSSYKNEKGFDIYKVDIVTGQETKIVSDGQIGNFSGNFYR